MSCKFRVNDEVIVISGKDKGKKGFIKKIYHKYNKVIINGINLIYKHVKSIPNKNIPGGIVRKESFIDISNISHFCVNTDKTSKIGFKVDKNKKVRYLKRNKMVF